MSTPMLWDMSEDADGQDEWETLRQQLPPMSDDEQEAFDAFMDQIHKPLGPGDPRRHHYIPRSFQKRFSDPNEQLLVFRLDDPENPKSQHTSDIAVQRDLYTHVDQQVGETVAVEKILAVLDGNAARILKNLDFGLQPFPATLPDRAFLAMWMAFLLVRDPHTRRVMEAISDQMLKFDLSLCSTPEQARARLRSNLDREPTPQEVSGLLEAAERVNEMEIICHQNDYIKTMLTLASEMYLHLWRRKYTVLRFAEPGLVLSDRPLVLYRDPERWHPQTGVGVATADELWLPLDRRNVLVLHNRPLFEDGAVVKGLPPEFRHVLNQAVIGNTTNRIYCHPSDRAAVDSSEIPDPQQPLLGVEAGSWFKVRTDGVNAPPTCRRPRRYRRQES